jgi:hypothetical protein
VAVAGACCLLRNAEAVEDAEKFGGAFTRPGDVAGYVRLASESGRDKERWTVATLG